MPEHPIIFSAPMVRALLREIAEPGTGKTQTRRLAWRDNGKPSPWQKVQAGDALWVRENFKILEPISGSGASQQVRYCADPNWDDPPAKTRHWDSRPRGAIHLPRWACRILLDVTAVKVERIQDISEEDARAEGIMPHIRGGWHWHQHNPHDLDDWHQFGFTTAAYAFQDLWCGLHGADAWSSNPEVVAITFKPRHKEPTQ